MFSTRPANVTRAKNTAPTGSSNTSAAADATAIAATAASRRLTQDWIGERCRHEDREGRAAREYERRIRDRQRIHSHQDCRDDDEGVERWTALIEHSRAKVDDGHDRGAIDGRAAANKPRVADDEDDRGQHRGPTEPADPSKRPQQDACEDRDVATRNGDNVIGAGLLQPALDVGL